MISIESLLLLLLSIDIPDKSRRAERVGWTLWLTLLGIRRGSVESNRTRVDSRHPRHRASNPSREHPLSERVSRGLLLHPSDPGKLGRMREVCVWMGEMVGGVNVGMREMVRGSVVLEGVGVHVPLFAFSLTFGLVCFFLLLTPLLAEFFKFCTAGQIYIPRRRRGERTSRTPLLPMFLHRDMCVEMVQGPIRFGAIRETRKAHDEPNRTAGTADKNGEKTHLH